jgi:hypothetical protein
VCWPIRYCCQVRAQSPLIDVVLSYHPVWGGVGFRPPLPKGERPPGPVSYLSVESLGRWWTEPIKGGFHPCQRRLSATMVIMRVLVEEFLCQRLRGWRRILESFPARCVWVSVVTPRHARL